MSKSSLLVLLSFLISLCAAVGAHADTRVHAVPGDAALRGVILLRSKGDGCPDDPTQFLLANRSVVVANCLEQSEDLAPTVTRQMLASLQYPLNLPIWIIAQGQAGARLSERLSTVVNQARDLGLSLRGIVFLGGLGSMGIEPAPDGAPRLLLLVGAKGDRINRTHGLIRRWYKEGWDSHYHVIPKATTHDLFQWYRPGSAVHRLVLDALQIKALSGQLADVVRAERRWRDPSFSSDGFLDSGVPINSYPIDDRFRALIYRVYGDDAFRLRAWPLERFRALDLITYLSRRFGAASGDFLTVTNVRGERLVWRMQDIRPYGPVLVVGIDDEEDLFRMSIFYQARRQYSWRDTPDPPLMVRSLGGFIYFLEPPPAELSPRFSAQFALTPNSFVVTRRDPLQKFRRLEPALFSALTHENGCLSCHALRGVGPRSHHLRAIDAQPHGGYALELGQYPSAVWKRFLYEQNAVAAEIGATPNRLAPQLRRALDALVRGSDPPAY